MPRGPRRRLLRRGRVLATLVYAGVLTGGGCAGFAAPEPATLAALQPMPIAGRLVPGRFVLELETQVLSGTFDGVCAVSPGHARLQLFPDVGGKVLDLTIGPGHVRAELPGSHYQASAPLDEAPPHLALALAALFAELLAPVGSERVRGERRSGDGHEVLLAPALGAGRTIATLTANGEVARYAIELGLVRLTFDGTGALHGRGVQGRLLPVRMP